MKILAVVAAAVLLLGGPVWADWNVGDPYKMHFAQLPNNSGQDMEPLLADDWQCSSTGPVSDIHFWTFSESSDPYQFLGTAPIYVTISTNDPNYQGLAYSAPSAMVWSRYIQPGQFTVRQWDTLHWQFNITGITDPFIQQAGQIYWLGLRIQQWSNPHLYWNLSDNHFMDNAVSWTGENWFPFSGDLAFVITPEPASVTLLALGALAMLRRRKV